MLVKTTKICNLVPCEDKSRGWKCSGCDLACAKGSDYYQHENGLWYSLLTASRLIKGEDDEQDPAVWLELSLKRAKRFSDIHWDMVPKEELGEVIFRNPKRKKKEMIKPTISAEELDKQGFQSIEFLRERRKINREVREISSSIRAYSEINRKFGCNSLVNDKVKELRQAKAKLLEDKKSLALRFPNLKQALDLREAENEWTKKWKTKPGQMTERVWLSTYKGRTFEINRHGLMIDRFYEILPDKVIILRLMKEANRIWGVPVNSWVSANIVTDERIEKLTRKVGKKTGSGARVQARKDHIRFADEVCSLMAELTERADIYVDDIENNPKLRKLYDDQVRPKIIPPEEIDPNKQEEESVYTDLHGSE